MDLRPATDPVSYTHLDVYKRQRMVYVLRADKSIRYKEGRSRIVYIGETERGTRRPAGSAASKAMRTFGVLPGIRRIDVHPLTFRGIQSACHSRAVNSYWAELAA